MGTVEKAILKTVGAAGFVVTVDAESVTAVDSETGERFIVRYEGDGFYHAVVELAGQVGIELEDGQRAVARRASGARALSDVGAANR